MSKHLHILSVVLVTIGLSPSMAASPVHATGADPPDQVEHAERVLCEALDGLILYFDENRKDFMTKAREEIEREALREALVIFEREDLGDASAMALIEDVEARRLRDFRGKLSDTAEQLRIVYRDGCLKTRGSMRAPQDARDVLSRPGFEFASVRRDVEHLGQYAPIEFKTPVFRCVGDFEMCRTTLDDELGCGITFMVCVGQQLIPFVSR